MREREIPQLVTPTAQSIFLDKVERRNKAKILGWPVNKFRQYEQQLVKEKFIQCHYSNDPDWTIVLVISTFAVIHYPEKQLCIKVSNPILKPTLSTCNSILLKQMNDYKMQGKFTFKVTNYQFKKILAYVICASQYTKLGYILNKNEHSEPCMAFVISSSILFIETFRVQKINQVKMCKGFR